MSGQGAARKLAARVTGRTRLLGVITAAVMAAIAMIISMSVNGVPFQPSHTLRVVLPPDTPPVDVADQVRLGGQRAGIIERTTIEENRSVVTLRLEPDAWPLPQGTTVRVRLKPASGLTYIDLVPAGEGELADNTTLPAARVTAGVSLPEAAEAFDAATRDSLATTVRTAGTGLIGLDETLATLIRDTERLLTDATPLVDALTPAPGTLAALLADSGAIAAALSGSGELPGAIGAGADVLAQLDASRGALGETLELAPGLQQRLNSERPEIEAVLAQTRTLLADLDPLTGDLAALLPDTRRLLASSGELRRASTTLSASAQKAFADAPAAMRALRGTTLLIKPANDELIPVVDAIRPYRSDIISGVKGLEAITTKRYSEGATAPGSTAVRFAPTLACHTSRNPFPKPGEAMRTQAPRGLTC